MLGLCAGTQSMHISASLPTNMRKSNWAPVSALPITSFFLEMSCYVRQRTELPGNSTYACHSVALTR